jgi:NADPH:quinone reductase-like Zn-dependent oxidoreductase
MNSRKIEKVLITGGAGFIGSAVVNVDALMHTRKFVTGGIPPESVE